MKKRIASHISGIVAVGLLFTVVLTSWNGKPIQTPFTGKTLEFKSLDGLKITADLYESAGKSDPVILLFHQAGYSRGEYRPTAPLLNKLGFTCLAIDQRSGNQVNGIVNETHLRAEDQNLGTSYVDALPDMEATLLYAKKHFPGRKIILWGSSYSSALVFVVGSLYKADVAGILSFSPGNYFKYKNKEISDYAKNIECPVFITSAHKEYNSWKTIFANIPSPDKKSFLPEKDGVHGSKALWKSNPNHAEYWNAVKSFLKQFEQK